MPEILPVLMTDRKLKRAILKKNKKLVRKGKIPADRFLKASPGSYDEGDSGLEMAARARSAPPGCSQWPLEPARLRLGARNGCSSPLGFAGALENAARTRSALKWDISKCVRRHYGVIKQTPAL